MKQKIIYLLFLNIGVLVSLVSCGRIDVEYIANADIIYNNETNHNIRYYMYDETSNQKGIIFEIPPKSTFKKEIRSDGGNKVKVPGDYIGFFGSFQGNGANLIEYDSIKCIIYRKGEGSTTDNFLNTFQAKKINDRHYEFTYTFTEEEAQKATACP